MSGERCLPTTSALRGSGTKRKVVQDAKWAKTQSGPRRKVGQNTKWAKMQSGPRCKVGQDGKWAKMQSGPRRKVGQDTKWALAIYNKYSMSGERCLPTTSALRGSGPRRKVVQDAKWAKTQSGTKRKVGQDAKWDKTQGGPRRKVGTRYTKTQQAGILGLTERLLRIQSPFDCGDGPATVQDPFSV